MSFLLNKKNLSFIMSPTVGYICKFPSGNGAIFKYAKIKEAMLCEKIRSRSCGVF